MPWLRPAACLRFILKSIGPPFVRLPGRGGLKITPLSDFYTAESAIRTWSCFAGTMDFPEHRATNLSVKSLLQTTRVSLAVVWWGRSIWHAGIVNGASVVWDGTVQLEDIRTGVGHILEDARRVATDV